MAIFESPIAEYDRYFARGSDKVCFVAEKHPGKILKLAPKSQAEPMLREIRYTEWLMKRGVKPSFMPAYYGRVETDKYVGFIQEMVSGEEVLSLNRYLEKYWVQGDLSVLEDNIVAVHREMLDLNVIVRGQHNENFMIDAKTMKIWVIDGYGVPEFIPVSQYFRLFGTRKLKVQMAKFRMRYGNKLISLAEEHGFWVESRFAKCPEKFAAADKIALAH